MERFDGAKVYRSSESRVGYPVWLRNFQDKLIVDIEGVRPGPYDTVMDFENSRSGLRGLVPETQRLTAGTDRVTFLASEHLEIAQAMSANTALANDPNRNSDNPEDRKLYRENLRVVYRSMAGKVLEWTGNNPALFFPPKNGGVFVQDVFQQVFEDADYSGGTFYDYRMSRIQKEDGCLMVGITDGENNPQITDFRRFVFADDCMASDISAFGTLKMIQDSLRAGKVPLSEAQILVVVSAATQRGIESLLTESAHLGFGELKIVTGIVAHKMNEHYYLQHPDGRQVVGDMGNWTQAVPQS